MADQSLLNLNVLCEFPRSHSDTQHSVGLLWTSDRPVTDNSTWKHTTLTETDIDAPQQASGCRLMPCFKHISTVCVAVSAQEMQGLTVGWGLRHNVASTSTKYVLQ